MRGLETRLHRLGRAHQRRKQEQADAKLRALIDSMTGDEFLACMTEILYRAEAAHGPLEVSSEEVIETDRTGYDDLLRSLKRDLIACGEYAPPGEDIEDKRECKHRGEEGNTRFRQERGSAMNGGPLEGL